MAYIAPPGRPVKGEGTVSAAEVPSFRVCYLEAGFECVAYALPNRGLMESLRHATSFALEQTAKQLRLKKKDLRTRLSADATKKDGSPACSVEEWAAKNFIIVEMKQDKKDEGLLGRFNKQKDFLENLIRKDMVSGPSLMSAPVVDIDQMSLNLEKQVKDLTTENTEMKSEIKPLTTENTELTTENTEIKSEIEALKIKVDSLTTEIEALKIKVTSLSSMDSVLIRKMLEKCRNMCKDVLKQRGLEFSEDWNVVIEDPICVSVLEEKGLTSGLLITKYGRKTKQWVGSRAAHDITEDAETYATIICKKTGIERERLSDVFHFVFGQNPEELEFDEEDLLV